jgi:hypothetical protein
MKVNLDNPIKPLKSISFEREENKKQLALITSTDIYFLPVKKYKFIR